MRRLRTERGLSQAVLAERLHHSGALVGKIEKAERLPSVEFCERADAVLHTGGILLKMRPAVDPQSRCEYACFTEPTWSIGATLRALRELNGGWVDRRDFIAVTGSALVAAAVRWSSAVSLSDIPVGGARRLGASTLERLSRRLADLRVLDDELGGTVLRDVARAELEWLRTLMDQHDLNGDEQRLLLGLIAEAARLCGWSCLDSDRHAGAQFHYALALRCSASAGDPFAGANILAGMSFQATLAGHISEALTMLDTAERKVGRNASPKLKALLASRRARAHARAGDVRGCSRALNAAEAALDLCDDGHREPDWIYFFDEAELAAQAGACWVELRQPNRARPLLDGALRDLAPQYVRDRTIYQMRSVQTHLHDGDLHAACAELTTATELAGRTGSARSISSIRDARRAMSPHEKESVVRDFDRVFAEMVGHVA